MYLSPEERVSLIPLKNKIVKSFGQENWHELGLITDCTDIIGGHGRLLRSLSFGDPDYSGCVLDVLIEMINKDEQNLRHIEKYVSVGFTDSCEYISSTDNNSKTIAFCPNAFKVPDTGMDCNLLSVMMPFNRSFDGVYQAIKLAAEGSSLTCNRADDIWNDSVLIQDVFSLIYRSFIVICDFTGKNPNVFYEAGIAHTLGKHVIPITQSSSDIPFDLSHHRYVHYLNNGEGLQKLREGLAKRIFSLKNKQNSIF